LQIAITRILRTYVHYLGCYNSFSALVSSIICEPVIVFELTMLSLLH